MITFAAFFYFIYNLVAFFYLISGVVLLLYPHTIQNHIKKLFPLLASWRLDTLVNSLNLVGVGSTLIIIGQLIDQSNVLGYFLALILSTLEVYLGIKFYYHEEHDTFQAIVHIVLHTILVGVLLWFMVNYFSSDISIIQNNVASVVNVLF